MWNNVLCILFLLGDFHFSVAFAIFANKFFGYERSHKLIKRGSKTRERASEREKRKRSKLKEEKANNTTAPTIVAEEQSKRKELTLSPTKRISGNNIHWCTWCGAWCELFFFFWRVFIQWSYCVLWLPFSLTLSLSLFVCFILLLFTPCAYFCCLKFDRYKCQRVKGFHANELAVLQIE